MRKFKVGDLVKVVDDEPYKYGHRIPIGTITKIVTVSRYFNSPFPYITQHSMRELKESELKRVYKYGDSMYKDEDFKIVNVPTLEDFRNEFRDSINPSKELSEYGLIDTKGHFYSCDFGGHSSLADIICDYSLDDDLILEVKQSSKSPLDFLVIDKKWVSIAAKDYNRVTSIVCSCKLNKIQENLILDYIELFKLNKYPNVITLKE